MPVSNPRGMGLFCAFDLPSKEHRTRFLAKAYEEGLLMVGCGATAVRFRPPLNVSTSEIDAGIDIIGTVLNSI